MEPGKNQSGNQISNNDKKVRDMEQQILDQISLLLKESNKFERNLENDPENKLLLENYAQNTSTLGTLYWKIKRFNDSRTEFVKAIDIYSQLNDEFHLASVRGALGSLYLQFDNLDAALTYTKKAYEFWKDQTFLNEKLACIQNLGIIHKLKEDIENASKYILEAMQMSIHLKDDVQFAISIQVLLEYYELKEDYQMLIELKLKALEFWISMELVTRQFKTLIDLGVLFQIIEDYEQSLVMFKKGFNIAYNENNLDNMYLSQGFIAEAFFNMKNIDKAKETYLEVYKLGLYIDKIKELNCTHKDTHNHSGEKSLPIRNILISLGVSDLDILNAEKQVNQVN